MLFGSGQLFCFCFLFQAERDTQRPLSRPARPIVVNVATAGRSLPMAIWASVGLNVLGGGFSFLLTSPFIAGRNFANSAKDKSLAKACYKSDEQVLHTG